MCRWTTFYKCSSGENVASTPTDFCWDYEKMQTRNFGMHESCKVSTKTSVFGFNDQLTMVSYVPKKNKTVILFSTVPHGISIVEEDPKTRPEIIKFYNETKIGVDLVDQIIQTYTCKRQTRRWPLILFYNVLDIAALNAHTVFRQVYPDYLSGHCSRRRCFRPC